VIEDTSKYDVPNQFHITKMTAGLKSAIAMINGRAIR
jgi:hypothetical protein